MGREGLVGRNKVDDDADNTPWPPSLPCSVVPHCDVQDEPEPVKGFKRLMEAAHIPNEIRAALLVDLEDLGAASVSELIVQDWEQLPAWSLFKPLQKRRLLQQAVGPRSDNI